MAYQYKFVRLKAGRLGFGGFEVADEEYRHVIGEHAREGWRLVQVFAPSLTSYGRAKFYEVILERSLDQ